MIEETLGRIEKTVTATESLSEQQKKDLLGLIGNLKNEINDLGDSYQDEAGTIARYAESSVKEAVKKTQNTELLNHSLEGLSLSVKNFEVSHPTLIGIINSIGQTLNNIGI